MACYKPLEAWRSKEKNEGTGKRSLVFNWKQALEPDSPIEIPCGQCIGCRLERSRQWAMRCLHEASLHERNCFLTLTFSPEHITTRDNPWSVDVRDFQLFMKRLRKRYGSKIRFFHCGEYGEKNLRPHYHAILFNHDFDDRTLFKVNNGHPLYISEELSSLWPFGFATIGDVTFESAAYVARYVMKKVTGDAAEEHYKRIDPDTGELIDVKPEYTTMSRRPGIAADWIAKYVDDVYPKDFVIVNGKKVRPPKFYDAYLDKVNPFEHDWVKDNRIIDGRKYSANNTPERLKVREEVKKMQLQRLVRDL